MRFIKLGFGQSKASDMRGNKISDDGIVLKTIP